MYRRWTTLAMLVCLGVALTSCPHPPKKDSLTLRINGVCKTPAVPYLEADGGVLLDVDKFMKAVDGRFVPVIMNQGMVTQYGKRIGFCMNGYEFAMVQAQLCPMAPRSRMEGETIYAPLCYFEAMTDGALDLNLTLKTLSIKAPEPQKPGDVVPEARGLAKRLRHMGYTVQQGEVCLTSAIDVVRAGYSVNANGNNAGFPYLCVLPPLPPEVDHALFAPQFVYTMREDEALVLIGRTPPESDYYSYRSYMMSLREDDQPNPFVQKKIYTQLGDPINSYNITDGSLGRNRFRSFFTLVSTADENMYQAVADAMRAEGLDTKDLMLDVLDHNLLRMGNDDRAYGLNFLHRVSCVHDKDAEEDYVNRPTVEVLRITPPQPRPAKLLEPFTPRTRGSGVTEAFLQPSVDALRDALVNAYKADYDIQELNTQPWLNITGKEAIDTRTDVLGETRDTLYLASDQFPFNEDTIVIVYGVNHMTVPKTVYNNVSCYGAKYFNGFGGITNYEYTGSACPYLPGDEYADKLYVWKFARTKLDDQTCVVDTDEDNTLDGLNNGATAFMGFRNYIDPGCLLGPDPEEIIFDRALVLTPK